MLKEKVIFYHVVVLLAAVQLNWQIICFPGEALAVTLSYVLFKHGLITSNIWEDGFFFPTFFIFFLLKNVGRMHQNVPSDLKCSRNFNLCAVNWLSVNQPTKRYLIKNNLSRLGCTYEYREMGSGNKTCCTAFVHSMPKNRSVRQCRR